MYIPCIYIYHIVHTCIYHVHDIMSWVINFLTGAVWAGFQYASHLGTCHGMSSQKPVRNNAIVQEVNNWYRHIEWWYSLPISGGKLSCEKLDKHMELVVVKLYRYAIICTNTYMTLSHRKAYHLRLAGYTIIQCVCTNNSILVQ